MLREPGDPERTAQRPGPRGRARPRIRERRAHSDRASDSVEAAARPDLALTLGTDENHRSGCATRTAASTRRRKSMDRDADAERAARLLREAKQQQRSENCDVRAQTRHRTSSKRTTGAAVHRSNSGRIRRRAAVIAQTQRCGSAEPREPRDDRSPGERSSRLASSRRCAERPRKRHAVPTPDACSAREALAEAGSSLTRA